MKNPMACV